MSVTEGIGGVGRRYHGGQYQKLVPVYFLANRLMALMPVATRAIKLGPGARKYLVSPVERISFAILSVGDEELSVLAHENCEYCPGDFVSVAHDVLRDREVPASITSVPGLEGVESVVAVFDDPRLDDSIWFATAYVRQPDTTVQSLRFWVRRNSAHDLDGVRMAAIGVLRHLAPGPRRLDSVGGAVDLGRPGDPLGLRLSLPAGWVVNQQRGDGFRVYLLERMRPFNGTGAWFTIYVGRQPPELPLPHTSGLVIPLFGRPRRWVWRHPTLEDPNEQCEIITPLPGGDGLQVHAVIETAQPSLWPELEAIAASVVPTIE